MKHTDLDRLYEATGEDLLFAIGMLLTESGPAPYVHVFYPDWAREKLAVVRESFREGLTLAKGHGKQGAVNLYIATREQIALQADAGGHTSVLRAPAWDALLAEVEEGAVRMFEENLQRGGGFLLLLQTPEWEFLTAVDDAHDRTTIGPIEGRSLPMPKAGG